MVFQNVDDKLGAYIIQFDVRAPSTMMRMPIADWLHRGIVTSLFGFTVYGLFLGVAVHWDTLERGRREYRMGLDPVFTF